MEVEIAKAADEEAVKEIRAGYAVKESRIEHELDYRPMDFHLSLGVSYNFISK